MKGKPTRRRRLQMLHDLTNGDGNASSRIQDGTETQWNDLRNLLHSRRLKKNYVCYVCRYRCKYVG